MGIGRFHMEPILLSYTHMSDLHVCTLMELRWGGYKDQIDSMKQASKLDCINIYIAAQSEP